MPDLRRLNARGHGPAVLVIPGIQGRWEWLEPAVEALSARCRVLTFSLTAIDPERFFDGCIDYIDAALDAEGVERAAVVGVSFGGLVAVRYAARRPGRVSRLVLVSSPSPRWRPDRTSLRYIRRPRLSVPALAFRGVTRLLPEIQAAFPTAAARLSFTATHAWRTLRRPIAPRRMAAWVDAWLEADLATDCRAVTAPTLLLTGEARLDRVVPVSSSLDYLQLIPGTRHVVLRGTGHIGLMTKPREFAGFVTGFVEESS